MHRTEAFIIGVSESCSKAGQPGGGGNTILVTPEGPEAAWPWVCHRDRAYAAHKRKAWGQNHHTPPSQHTEPSTWTCRKSTLFLLPRMPPWLQDSLGPTDPHGIQGFTLPRALLPLSLPQSPGTCCLQAFMLAVPFPGRSSHIRTWFTPSPPSGLCSTSPSH